MLHSGLPADVSVLPAAPGRVERAQKMCGFMSSTDMGWKPSAFLYCSVTLSWSLNLSEPPL